ncbi:MAG TPA: helix-turn-helix domain-containing protein [Polyangiaceae bacterium]|nr:helix-turn-helix domain-containing protein [Polyangiaceae bacterium]
MERKANLETSLWLDLSDVAEGQRVDAWRSWMQASFPEFSVLASTPGVGGARGLTLGAARLWLVHFPAGMTLRAAPGDHFRRDAFVSFQMRGSRTLARDGHVHRIGAGHVCVGRAPINGSETVYEEDSTLLMLELPSPHVQQRHPRSADWRFHVSPADQPGAMLLHDLLARTLAVGEGLAAHERSIALAAALELLPLPILGVRARDAHVTRVERILASIDERLSEPRLTPERLAHQQGISRRRLDELFVSALGMPVAACIAERRLARAAQLLKDPTCDELSIASVANAAGFRDASHFARVFRRRFGATPKAWRAHA